MAVTESFLASCRTAIDLHPEVAAFRAAYALYDAASRADKGRYWRLAFDDAQTGLSPAYRLKKLVREVIASLADATVTPAEREAAYRTLGGEYVPAVPEPTPIEQEQLELQRLIIQELAS